MEVRTGKFKLYAGMRSEEYNLHMIEIEGVQLNEAMEEAEDFAYEIYYLNPDRDVLEIMKQDRVHEDKAMEIFLKEMQNSVIYHMEEIVEAHGQTEIIEHRWI
ncbi:hypothetical protein [Priestia megaterium]|uniref:hypothetical protein n=1 Tax=Priestia megaterium TaxID=1404 RepID=UPI000BFB4C69|nr:hypothetical protein [Priestia megaterium]PGO60748.1 hypothetical protein CN981_09425 [Priestia megaterium]